MRQHILINLFEDDFLQTNQLFVRPSQSSQETFKMLNNNLTNSINITLNEENSLSFNNFHDYLGSSYSIIYLIILIVTCIEILIGNSLLIYTVFSNKLFGNRLTTNHVVMSLAVSDFMIGLIIMPYYIFVVRLFSLTNEHKKSWHYEIWSNLDSSLTTASIYSLCLVTLDRYLALTRPLQYTRNISNKKVKLSIVLIWIVSILTTFLSSILMWILNFIIDDDYKRAISRRQIECNLYFHIVLTILTFYIPFVLILYFNIATYVTIKRRLTDNHLKIKRIESSNRSCSQNILINDDGKQSDNNSEISSQSDHTILTQQPSNNSGQLSNSNSKLCLNCFYNQNYMISVISENQSDMNNNSNSNGSSSNATSFSNSFKKKIFNRRCSLCSCHLNRNLKRENINQFNTSYHFSLTKQNSNSVTNGFTWKTFHRLFIEKIKQKHKEGLTKNYTFVFKEYKLVKLLLIMNCCFAFCYGPIYAYQELVRFNVVKVDNHLLNYLLFLGWLNSGADPLIYLHQSRKMRKEIKAKLCCFR